MLPIMKGILIFIALIIFPNKQVNADMINNEEKTKVIYVFDVLCGWCYGFSPVIEKFHENFKDQFEFEIISGGLIIGDRIGPYGDFADYILNAIPNLEATTGVTVGDVYKQQLREDKKIQSSIPPAIAIAIIKQKHPYVAFEFAHKIQKANFLHGKDLNNIDVYLELLQEMDLSIPDFQELFESDENEKIAKKEFNQVAQLGVRGFPAVLVKHKGEYTAISRGYLDYKSLIKNFNTLINRN